MGELGDRLAKGEQAAFAELYDACADRLFGYLAMRLGSAADAEDIVQETFVRLARGRRKLADVDNLVAYAFTVARNEAARMLRARPPATEGIDHSPLIEARCVPADKAALIEQETVAELAAAVSKLPMEQREIVELKIYGELTLREIAELTGLPQGTVATRHRTALARLRGAMQRHLYD